MEAEQTIDRVNEGLTISLKFVRVLTTVLFTALIILEYFPFDFFGLGLFVSNIGKAISNWISPIVMSIVVGMMCIRTPNRIRSIQVKIFLLITILTASCIAISAAVNHLPDFRVLPVACNFAIASVFILLINRQRIIFTPIFSLAFWMLGFLTIVPLATAPFEIHQPYFLNCPGNPVFTSFHGFFSSRLEFGFWSGFLALFLYAFYDDDISDPRKLWIVRGGFFIIFASLVAIQTRSSVFCATLLILWSMFFQTRQHVKLKAITLIAAFVLGVFLYGRFFSICESELNPKSELNARLELNARSKLNPKSELNSRFLINDPSRLEIYQRFIPTSSHKWLWGIGKMKLVSIEHISGVVQAHNIFLQTLGNFGIFTMASLLIWCGMLFRLFRTRFAKMLFVYFLGYSLFQPFFGGSLNFFSPQVLLTLMLIAHFDYALTNKFRRNK